MLSFAIHAEPALMIEPMFRYGGCGIIARFAEKPESRDGNLPQSCHEVARAPAFAAIFRP
jgi:hypothetical protein